MNFINKNYKILFNKGVILNKLNYKEESKKYYKKSIDENTNYPYSYLNLAVIYKEEHKFNEAISIITEGIINNENVGFLYYNRGCFYAEIGEKLKAFEDIERSIELDEFFLEYMKKDIELDSIRDLNEYIYKYKE